MAVNGCCGLKDFAYECQEQSGLAAEPFRGQEPFAFRGRLVEALDSDCQRVFEDVAAIEDIRLIVRKGARGILLDVVPHGVLQCVEIESQVHRAPHLTTGSSRIAAGDVCGHAGHIRRENDFHRRK